MRIQNCKTSNFNTVSGVLLLLVSLISMFAFTGCISKVVSRDFTNTVSVPQQERGGYYHIEKIEIINTKSSDYDPTLDKPVEPIVIMQKIFGSKYPKLFNESYVQNPNLSMPLSVTVTKTTKESSPLVGAIPCLTLGFIPWPDTCFSVYDVSIVSPVDTSTTSFTTSERSWFAWPPLGLIPVYGWGDARYYLSNNPEFNLFYYNCIADAVVATLEKKKCDSYLAQLKVQQLNAELARIKAEKELAEKERIEKAKREQQLIEQQLAEKQQREQQEAIERQWRREDAIAIEQQLAIEQKREREEAIKREEWNKLLSAQKKPVVFHDSTWVVLEAKNMGSVLKPRNSFGEEAKTEGVFILVKYQVVNTTKVEKRIIVEPVLVDSSLREFKTYDKQKSYFPVEGETITFEALPASITRTYYGIYEVAKDSKEIVFRARSLETLTQDFKNIPLAFRKEK
jgi:hypothetical protein